MKQETQTVIWTWKQHPTAMIAHNASLTAMNLNRRQTNPPGQTSNHRCCTQGHKTDHGNPKAQMSLRGRHHHGSPQPLLSSVRSAATWITVWFLSIERHSGHDLHCALSEEACKEQHQLFYLWFSPSFSLHSFFSLTKFLDYINWKRILQIYWKQY